MNTFPDEALARLVDLAPSERLPELHQRQDLCCRLWARSKLFAETLQAALSILQEPEGRRGRAGPGAHGLVHWTIAHVASPEDLVRLCRSMEDQDSRRLLMDYYYSPLASRDVILALASNSELTTCLPAGAWRGEYAFLYGSTLLNAYPTRQFELAELFPCGLVETADALLGSAAERRQLSATAVEEIRKLWPEDVRFNQDCP